MFFEAFIDELTKLGGWRELRRYKKRLRKQPRMRVKTYRGMVHRPYGRGRERGEFRQLLREEHPTWPKAKIRREAKQIESQAHGEFSEAAKGNWPPAWG